MLLYRTKLISGRYPALESFLHTFYYDFDNKILVRYSKFSPDLNKINSKKLPLWDTSFNKKSLLLGFLLTTGCNLRCRYCFAEGGRCKTINLKFSDAKKFIDYAISQGNRDLEIYFAGGEPTVNSTVLVDIVKYLESIPVNKELRIQTNGVMSDDLLVFLLNHNVHLQISYDGLPSIQNLQRPGIKEELTSESVIQTIKRAVQYDKNKTQITVTVTDKSVDHLVDMVLHLNALGVIVVQFEPVGKIVGKLQNTDFKKPKISKFVKNFLKAYRLGLKLGMVIFTSSTAHLYTPCSKYCHFKSKLTLTADANITLCDTVTHYNHPLAKFFIIGTITNEKVEYKINNVFSRSVNTLKKCQNCFAKYICAGGCINKAVAETSEINNIDNYTCKINKKIIKNILKDMI